MSKPIGVFDSGRGGLSVAKAIERALPDRQVLFVNDSKNVPYGTKSYAELLSLALPIFRELAAKAEIIVVACNTVTTTIIEDLRKEIPVPLIGMEPMVKPAAAQTMSSVIAVCATPATLGSSRYAWLKTAYTKGIKVLEPDCSDWALMIETNTVDRQKIHERIDAVCNAGADIIVLGCTHYHWIEGIIREEAAGRAQVLQPEQAIIARLKSLLKQSA